MSRYLRCPTSVHRNEAYLEGHITFPLDIARQREAPSAFGPTFGQDFSLSAKRFGISCLGSRQGQRHGLARISEENFGVAYILHAIK